MLHSYTTENVESFYMLIGIFSYLGYDLDFDFMQHYQKEHPDEFLVVVREN